MLDHKIIWQTCCKLVQQGLNKQSLQSHYVLNIWQNFTYPKVPKFSDARKLFCNLHIIQTKKAKLRVFYQNDANGIANSEDRDQTAPLGAV